MSSNEIKKLVKVILTDILTKVLPVLIGILLCFIAGTFLMGGIEEMKSTWELSVTLAIMLMIMSSIIGGLVIGMVCFICWAIYEGCKSYIEGHLKKIRRREARQRDVPSEERHRFEF